MIMIGQWETFAYFLLSMHRKRRPVPDIKSGAAIARNTVLACRDPTLSLGGCASSNRRCYLLMRVWGPVRSGWSNDRCFEPSVGCATPGLRPSADASATN